MDSIEKDIGNVQMYKCTNVQMYKCAMATAMAMAMAMTMTMGCFKLEEDWTHHTSLSHKKNQE